MNSVTHSSVICIYMIVRKTLSKSGDSYISSSINVESLESLKNMLSPHENGENLTGIKPMLAVPLVEAGKDGIVTEWDDHYSEIADALREHPRKIKTLTEERSWSEEINSRK